MTEILYDIKQVSKSFSLGVGMCNPALRQVSLSVYRGETLGILGESGSGKSTLARVMMGVYRPEEGELHFCGKRLSLRGVRERKAFGQRVQMVFQDPFQSLDPHMTVGAILAENLEIHSRHTKEERFARINELLALTGLPPDFVRRYPHELSGGQSQRISIARAIAAQPDFIVCDEPVSALDQSIRRQILALLSRLKKDFGLTYLMIAHDVTMLRDFSDRIAVMYAGRIVELGPALEVCETPLHPYTKLLLQAVLSPTPGQDRLKWETDVGEGVNGSRLGVGCPFADRCPGAGDRCRTQCPQLTDQGAGRMAACHKAPQTSDFPVMFHH